MLEIVWWIAVAGLIAGLIQFQECFGAVNWNWSINNRNKLNQQSIQTWPNPAKFISAIISFRHLILNSANINKIDSISGIESNLY